MARQQAAEHPPGVFDHGGLMLEGPPDERRRRWVVGVGASSEKARAGVGADPAGNEVHSGLRLRAVGHLVEKHRLNAPRRVGVVGSQMRTEEDRLGRRDDKAERLEGQAAIAQLDPTGVEAVAEDGGGQRQLVLRQ